MTTSIDKEWRRPSPHPVSGRESVLLEEALAEPIWSHGRLSRRFELEFAKFLGVRHAMLVPNGTSAVQLAIMANQIGAGHEVIVPGITWPSVAAAVLQTGATPRSADVDAATLCMSPDTVRRAITARTRAVLATHLFGSQSDMPALANLCNEYGLVLLEDAAQSIGSVQSGRRAGAWGAAGAFSLNDRKVLNCGEGGCVVTNSDEVNLALREFQLIQPERDTVPFRVPGTFKVSEFQAAVAITQLEALPSRLSKMSESANHLDAILRNADPHLRLQARPATVQLQSFFSYCLIFDGINIDDLQARLSDRLGLRVPRPYTPLARISDFDSWPGREKFLPIHEVCEIVWSQTLRLPHHVLMSDSRTISRLGKAILEEVARATD